MLVGEWVIVLAIGVLEAICKKKRGLLARLRLWLVWQSGRLTVAIVVGGVSGIIELEVSVECSTLVYFESLQFSC